jgi:hypothetical protein
MMLHFVAPDVRRAEIRDLALFLSCLECVLNDEQLPTEVVKQVMAESSHVTFEGTTDRSVPWLNE